MLDSTWGAGGPDLQAEEQQRLREQQEEELRRQKEAEAAAAAEQQAKAAEQERVLKEEEARLAEAEQRARMEQCDKEVEDIKVRSCAAVGQGWQVGRHCSARSTHADVRPLQLCPATCC